MTKQRGTERLKPHVALRTSEATSIGHGFISGLMSALLGIAGLGLVLGLRFPGYVQFGELRPLYDSPYLRAGIHVTLVASFLLGTVSAFLRANKALALTGIGFTLVAAVLGGSRVGDAGGVGAPSSWLAVDFFVLNLLLYSAVFVPLERGIVGQCPTSMDRHGHLWTLWTNGGAAGVERVRDKRLSHRNFRRVTGRASYPRLHPHAAFDGIGHSVWPFLQDLRPDPAQDARPPHATSHHATFIPTREMRGGTIAIGVPNVPAWSDDQFTFSSGLALSRLKTSKNIEIRRSLSMGNTFSTRRSTSVMFSILRVPIGSASTRSDPRLRPLTRNVRP